MRYIEYYEQSISESSFSEALDSYIEWCKDNEQEPEFTTSDLEACGFEAIFDGTLGHVVYHAELNGFDTEEHLVG